MATQDMIDYFATVMAAVLNKPADEDDEDSDPLVDVEFFKLHGNMSQKDRTEVFKTFKSSRSGVLLCTVSPTIGRLFSASTFPFLSAA